MPDVRNEPGDDTRGEVQLEDERHAPEDMAGVLDGQSEEIPEQSREEGVRRGVVPFDVSEIQTDTPTVRAIRKKRHDEITPDDIMQLWKIALDEAKDGKAWAIKFVLEKHPLAKQYARMEAQMGELSSASMAELDNIAGDALELPAPPTEEP